MTRIRTFHLVVLLLSACESGSSTPQAVDPATGVVEGRVQTLDGSPVIGASVEAGGVVEFTDESGLFTLDGVVANKSVSLFARSNSTTLGHANITVSADETVSATLTVLPLSHATLPDASAGGVVETDDGLRVEFPPDGIVNANGEIATGAVDLAYALFDEVDEMSAAPGNMKAEGEDGAVLQLVSDGMLSLELWQDGEPLNLGLPAEIAFPQVGITPPAGAVEGLYYFAEESGLWRQEGVGVSEGGRYVATVEHLTFWNDDWGQDLRQTVCGHLLWSDGTAVRSQLVGVIQDDGIHTNFTTGADGSFELTVPDGAVVNLGFIAEEDDSAEIQYWTFNGITVPALSTGAAITCIDLDPIGATGQTPNGKDADGDGAESPAWGGDDCDDGDPSLVTERAWYQDLDGDGYGAGSPFVTCSTPAQSALVDGDCAWDDPAVHPDAVELCDDLDGLDNDCDGWTDPECGTGWMRGLAGLTEAPGDLDCSVYWQQTWEISEETCPTCTYVWEVSSTLDTDKSVGLANCTAEASLTWTLGFDSDYNGQGYGVLWMADDTGTWTPTAMNAAFDDTTGMLGFYSIYNQYNVPYYDNNTGEYLYYTLALYGEAAAAP